MSSGRFLVYRIAAPFCALLMFLFLTSLYWAGQSSLYAAILNDWGILPFHFPFLDISGSLAAWECARKGINIVLADPCDLLNRPYNYSPLWMSLSWIPLGPADRAAVGWWLDLLVIASLYFLPPPRRAVEAALIVAATLSTMVVFALERAQPDILMFLMAIGVGYLALGGPRSRLFAHGLALLAALIKYYPVMMLVLVWNERPRRFYAICAAIIGVLIVFSAVYYADLVLGIPTIPGGYYFTDMFGAKNLPYFIGDMVQQSSQPAAWAALAGRLTADGLLAVLGGGCWAICRRVLRDNEWSTAFSALNRYDAVFLVLGSAVIVGCFFVGQNVGYRGIFLLFVVPGILALARSACGALRRLTLATAGVIVLLMWGECLRLALYRLLDAAGASEFVAFQLKFLFWLVRELGWWWAITIMIAAVVHYLRHAAAVEGLSPLWLRCFPRRAAREATETGQD